MASTEKKSLIQQMAEVDEEHQRRMEEKDRAFKVRFYLLNTYLYLFLNIVYMEASILEVNHCKRSVVPLLPPLDSP